MRKYETHLKLQDEANPRKREALAKQYCRGWFLGSPKAKKDLAKDLGESAPMVDWEGVDLKVLNQTPEKRNHCQESVDRSTPADGAPKLRQQSSESKLKSLDFAFDPFFSSPLDFAFDPFFSLTPFFPPV